jgi:hypothetical protein
MAKSCPRWVLTGLVAVAIPLMGSVSGCSQADQPKLADAPPVQPQKAVEPPKIPGVTKPFTKVDGYSKYMSKGGQTR